MEDLLPYYQNFDSSVVYYDTQNVYDLTLMKKEFEELKSSQEDIILNGSLPHQKFMTRFMSPHTPYNRMLVFHELGTGKCVHPDTNIYVDDVKTEIKELWSKNIISSFKDTVGEWKDISHLNIETLSYKEGKFLNKQILKLYRQYIQESIIIYTTEKTSIICTKAHKLLTNKGWINDVEEGMLIMNKNSKYDKIISKKYVKYQGYVYDLEIKDTHNYVAEDIVTHNTCLMSNVVEYAQSSGYDNKALILVKSDTQKKNIMKEIASRCFPDKYKFEIKEEMNDDFITRRLNKLVSKNYDIRTFYTFAKEIRDIKNKEALIELYSNKYIFVDEAHRLREKTTEQKKEKVDVYKELHNLFHSIKNCKILLMTGTPMKDKATEICSIMNLLLPLNKQMNENELFENELLRERDFNQYFYGIVSYVSQLKSNVKVEIEGDVASNMKYIKTYRLNMTEYQSKNYMISFEKERKNREIYEEEDEEDDEEEITKKSLYKESRQKSLFVFPENTNTELKEKQGYYYLNNELKMKISLEELKKYSVMYHFVINKILNESFNEKIFVFGNIVRNTGINLLGALLYHFGFFPIVITENFDIKKFYKEQPINRYAVLSGSVSDKIISKIVDIFNHPENINGKYLKVIIGSSKISEGLSLKEVRKCFITTPFWNNTETEQSIGRVLRTFSHDRLPKEQRGVIIYRIASIANNNLDDSIDMIRYKLSEDKDIKIKSIEKLLKQNAIDCALNKERNQIIDDCLHIKKQGELIYDTYNLFFADEQIQKVKSDIIKIFETKFIVDLSYIKKNISVNELIIVRAFNELINNNIPIINNNGAISYIREDRDLYFLTDDPKTPSIFTNSYYTQNPVFNTKENFNDYVKILNYETVDERIKIMMNSADEETINSMIETFDSIIIQKLICVFYISEITNYVKSWFMQKFGRFIIKAKYTYCFYIYNESEKLEDLVYLNQGKWENVQQEQIEEFNNYKNNIYKYMKDNNPYGYYAIPSDEDYNLKIVLIEKDKLTKKGTVSKKTATGLSCGTGSLSVPKIILYYIIFGAISDKIGNIKPYPILNLEQITAFNNSMINFNTIEKLKKSIQNEKAWKNKFEKKIIDLLKDYNKTNNTNFEFNIDNINDFEELKRIYMIILYNDMKINLCPGLKKWFNDIGYFSNI